MKRLIENILLQWKHQSNRKPLLLQGARQVGKTYVLQAFGTSHFKRLHYFDLEILKSDMLSIFNESSLNPKHIIEKFSFISGQTIDLENDLLVLDEIQTVPRAVTALKYFYQDMPRLAVAAAGSNLGVAHTEAPFPVGKVEIHTMFPMNFKEFLTAIKEDTSLAFLENFSGKGKTDDIYHKHLFDLLKRYFITGGMPEVVAQYVNTKNDPLKAFQVARKLQNQLLLHYERDFSKYAGNTNSRHIERVFQSIPLQLSNLQNKKAKKFKFKDVISKGYRSFEDLADPVTWLVKAGLALKVHINEHPLFPILAAVKENYFKLFLFDIGLLGAMTGLQPEQIMQYNYGSYKGYFAENFVLQELISYGYNQTATWAGRTSELEFITEIDGVIIPIEVKAGVNTKAKSLAVFINKYKPVYSVKITGNKFGYDQSVNIYNYPLYMLSRFPELCRR